MRTLTVCLTLLVITGVTRAQTPDIPTIHTSLSLADAITLGVRDNPSTAAAVADARVGHAQVESAAAARRPRVSANAFGTGGSEGAIYNSAPGVLPSTNFLSPSNGAADGNLTLMVPLITSGKQDADLRAARAQAEAGDRTADATRRSVARDVSLAYDRALGEQALVDAAKARADAEEEQVRVTKERVDTGRMAPVDLLREQAEQADAQQALVSAQNDAALAMVDLKVALGVAPDSDISLTDTLDTLYAAAPASIPGTVADALKEAVANRPEMLSANRSIQAARAATTSAKAAYGPQVYGVVMGDAMAVNNMPGTGGYTVGLTASLPIVDGGAKRADIDAASAHLTRAQADAAIVRQSITRDVMSAWLDLQSAEQQRASALTGLSAAKENYDLEVMRYNAGKSITVERLDSLSALTRARANLANADVAVLDARARLLWATGVK